MKKYLGYVIGVIIIAGVAIYWFLTGSGSNSMATNQQASGGTTTSDTNSATTTNTTSSDGNMGGMAMGSYKDGTYTGSLADAVYGKLQLVVTIKNSMITNITWPTYPDAPGHTQQVNDAALPQLNQEAIAAQNANVNIISGATQTSEAYQQSLASALTQAQ